MADFWYPRFAPAGDYLAAGSALLQVAPVTLASPPTLGTVVEVGEGVYPTWISSTRVVFHNRLNGGAARICQADAPAFAKVNIDNVARPSNRFVGGGGVWVNYADGSPLTTSTGLSLANRSWPAIDTAGRFAHTNLAQTEATASDSGVIAQGQPITDLSVATQGIAWSNISPGQFRRTFGVKAGSASVENLSIFSTHEYLPVVVDTPAGPWLLIQTPSQLVLHPWGNANFVPVFAGELNFPHAIYQTAANRFLVAGSQTGNLVLREAVINILDPLYVVGAGSASPGSGGTASPTATPTQKIVEAQKLAAARKPRAVYPHEKQIKDPDAAAAVRILYDRIFQVEQLIGGTGGVTAQITAVQQAQASRDAAVQTQIEQLTVAGTGTSIALGGAFPSGGGGSTPGTGGGGSGGGGGGQSGNCAGAPGTGHIPAGELTFTRMAQIICGTATEWGQYKVATADLATRQANAENLILRMIWHLQLGGFNAGRQRNPSTAISKDKLACVILTETRAFDVFADFDNFANTLRVGVTEVFPADLVASAGISD